MSVALMTLGWLLLLGLLLSLQALQFLQANALQWHQLGLAENWLRTGFAEQQPSAGHHFMNRCSCRIGAKVGAVGFTAAYLHYNLQLLILRALVAAISSVISLLMSIAAVEVTQY